MRFWFGTIVLVDYEKLKIQRSCSDSEIRMHNKIWKIGSFYNNIPFILKTLVICILDLVKLIIRGKLFPRLSLRNRWIKRSKWSWKKGKRKRKKFLVLKSLKKLKLGTLHEKSNLVKYPFPSSSKAKLIQRDKNWSH